MAENPNFGAFRTLWESDSSEIAAWVRTVADGFYNLELQGQEWKISAHIGVPLAELIAVLRLAALSDDELSMISDKRPARVFWLQLAEVKDKEELAQILMKFNDEGEVGPSMNSIQSLLSEAQPKSLLDLVRELSGEDYWFLASKAKNSGVTQPKENSLLASCAKMRQSGRDISTRQAKWAADIIQRLIDAKFISDSEFSEDRETNLVILAKLRQG